MVEESKEYKRRKWAYKKQGVVQAPHILGSQAIVIFVRDLLVDGPEICGWVGPDLLRFPACNCHLKSKARQS